MHTTHTYKDEVDDVHHCRRPEAPLQRQRDGVQDVDQHAADDGAGLGGDHTLAIELEDNKAGRNGGQYNPEFDMMHVGVGLPMD